MKKFTTRVELHKANSEDYDTLHTEMMKEGFSTTIQFENDDNIYQLPTAEYNRAGENLTSQNVLDSAKRAAAKTNKTFSVLVTKADGPRYIHNLEIVKTK